MENQSCEFNCLEQSHSLVHEICFNLENGNIDKTKELLRQLDLLLHDEIAKTPILK